MAPIDAGAREQTLATIVAELAKLGLDVVVAATAQRSIQALVTGWATLRMRAGRQENSSEKGFLQKLRCANRWLDDPGKPALQSRSAHKGPN